MEILIKMIKYFKNLTNLKNPLKIKLYRLIKRKIKLL